jgi:hypothetical protein
MKWKFVNKVLSIVILPWLFVMILPRIMYKIDFGFVDYFTLSTVYLSAWLYALGEAFKRN